MYKNIINYFELLTFFIVMISYMYFLEFIILIIKNLLSMKPIFDFPIGFIYIGFL